MEDENEEKLLRAVTLQNARAILHARERSEQELLKAKEELERSNQQITELLARERETREEAEKYVAELQQASAEIQESRRAALNLMEDAVQSRERADSLNQELRGEIADRKQAEQGLRESEERFRRLVEGAPFGMYIVDSQFRIAHMNAGSQNGAFKNVRPVIGRDLSEAMRILWREDVAQQIIAISRHTLDTGEPYYSKDFVNPRSDIDAVEGYEWELQRISLPDGAPGVICYYYDSTNLRLAEQALRESEERFRTLVSVITDVPWTTDAEGAFIARQQAWEAYTGQSWEEHRGFGWANALHPEDRERVKAVWQRACESRTLYKTDGRVWHAPTHQWRYFTVKATPILNTDGGVREWVGTCTDVDDVKRAEAERERLLAREHQARQEAEEANRLKDEFLATVSHELRTPLNSILGWANILLRGGFDKEAARHAIETIARNARAQNQLIADLLDVSRAISGKLRFELGLVELIPVIKAALETVRPAAEAKGVELRLALDPAAGLVSGDTGRLRQVVWNLLTNAIKYTPGGGLVETRLEREGTFAAIVVRDTGEGISADFLPYVFARFRQADGTTTRKHGGLGLGLAIVRSLVESHGGTVRADSAGAGQGATFTVTLPLIVVSKKDGDGEPVNDEARRQPPAPRKLEGVRVLVVDDEPDARELLMLSLTQDGAEVRVGAGAREALEILDQWIPDVLVSDIGMPSEDGYTLIKEVRTRKPEQGGLIPALALTGYASDEDATRARDVGFQLHLAKPVEPVRLIAAVASLARLTRSSANPGGEIR